MPSSSSPKKSNPSDPKFLFDRHNFDSPDDTREEDEPPPPPTFTEEELAAEKAKSFEEGKRAGLDEAAASREQQIAQTLNVIAEEFSSIFAAEQLRENLFERESVKFAQTMLKVVLPELNARAGNSEIVPIIQKTLNDLGQKSAITIIVPETAKADIEKYLLQKWPDEETRPRFRLIGDPDMSAGSCGMAWEDGGAVRNTHDLVEKIRTELTKLLPEEVQTPETNPESETGDSPEAENNVITKGKDSLGDPAEPDPETGDDHE